MSNAAAMLDQARTAMEKKEFVNAFDLAAESAESLKRDEKQALELRLAEARTMLAILKELNCESITLKDKMAKAEEMKGKNNLMQALRTANDVIQFSHSIMMDELTREMAATSRVDLPGAQERGRGHEARAPPGGGGQGAQGRGVREGLPEPQGGRDQPEAAHQRAR